MVCSQCGHENAEDSRQCVKCTNPLPFDNQTLATGLHAWSVPPGEDVVVAPVTEGLLSPGSVLGHRYEIIKLLGQGGMGAVYQAHDRELERMVALKVIRGDMAANPEILRRFKQELILARQVTHKNVIRIFDLGKADGVKFITMDYVDGKDLRAVLKEKGKLPAKEAAWIMLQICRALEAAHAEGVIHRDLKPQNIMLDERGRVYVMDFGIARSAHLPGMTQTGALIGTPEYMSPEQGQGMKLDERSDIFSLGVIFYELLTGKSPFYSDTPLATLWKRMHEKAAPPITIDPAIPAPVNEIVVKALEIEPDKRFATAREMGHQLEVWLGPTAGSSTVFLPAPKSSSYWKWASVGLGVLLVAAVVALRFKGPLKPAPGHPPVNVLVADFANATGDSIFDGTLEPPLSVALEDASFISSFSRNQAKKIVSQLQPGNSSLEGTTARLVAVREGIGFVVTGLVSRRGDGFEVRARVLEGSTGKILMEVVERAGDKKSVLGAVEKIAAQTRRALGDTTPESVQLAAAEAYTTSSLEAAHAYAAAQDLQWAGKWEEAIPQYQRAIQFDADLGRAYAGLASTSANMGHRSDAEKYYKLALAHIGRMSDREKYRTRGGYYLAIREPQKAIEEYSALVQQFPSEIGGYSNLALAYFYLRDMPKALEQGKHAVELAPRGVLQRNNLALYAVYAGDYVAATAEARKVLEQNPTYVNAFGALAMAQTGQGNIADADQTYQKMAAVSARGADMAALGRADLLLYQGQTKDAIEMLEKSLSSGAAKMDGSTIAAHQLLLAEAKLAAGKAAEAAADAKSALAHDSGGAVQFAAGNIYVQAGQSGAAQALVMQLAAHLDADDQAYAKLLEGELALKRGDAKGAIADFEESRKIADTWLVRLNLGRAYLEAGAFTEADSELEKCLRRRGEASALFLDDVPTFRSLPQVYYYLGRAQEGLKSSAATDSYKTFLAIKEKGDEVGLVKDAQKRLSNR